MSKIGVKVEEIGAVMLLSIEGHFDAPLASAVSDRVHDIIESSFNKIIFDLSDLAYISSAGLRVLLFSAKKMKHKGGEVVLCSVGGGVKRVLDISGFTNLFVNYDNREVALKEINK